MNTLERIKKASIEARKAKHTIHASLLTTLYADIVKVGKDKRNGEPTEEEAIATIRKYVSNNAQALEAIQNRTNVLPTQTKLEIERIILQEYLPADLTKEQIIAAMAVASISQPLSMKSMPVIKAYIDEQWPGSYDGRKVSELLKERVSGTA